MRLLMKGAAGTGWGSGWFKSSLSFINLFVLCSLGASVTPLVSAQSLKSPTSSPESKTILPSVGRVEILPVISTSDQTAAVSPTQTNEPNIGRANENSGTDWGKTLRESIFFVGVMHSYRLWIEPDTRAPLGGPFFKDYFRALKHLRGWSDGDNFF